MNPKFLLGPDSFTIQNYNQARPFSSFLPGIAGEQGKPMWLFYTNRGQCVSGFGVGNKNGAMLEFYPANRAYNVTPLVGFRTFLKIGSGPRATVYEPFKVTHGADVEQQLRIRRQEIEIEETNRTLGLRVRAVVFNVPNEDVPVVLRCVEVENLSRRRLDITLVDGLPQIVSYGLGEWLLKQMSRTMEAFAEVQHHQDLLPFFKLKVEPSDKPEVQWIEGGFFNFSLMAGKAQKVLVDPESVFGHDTSFAEPVAFAEGRSAGWTPRTESLTPCAMSMSRFALAPSGSQTVESFYGQADRWSVAQAYRQKVQRALTYTHDKRRECAELLERLTDAFALHTGVPALDPYSRQSFLDNTLRGGRPFVVQNGDKSNVFHFYSRKHGDMERDYNFFEVSPTYYSQGNGNFRDVNQNRRSEVLLYPGVGATNIETFFNLIQLDGYNPLVIQFEKFYLPGDAAEAYADLAPAKQRAAWKEFLGKPFSPGALLEKLIELTGSAAKAQKHFTTIVAGAEKIQDAAHGEGYWVDHWLYNLDLLENYTSVYPDQLRALFIERKDFTYFDNDHVVQPRSKKYVRRADGAIRQMHAVVRDNVKSALIRTRRVDPNKVRTKNGEGVIFRTSLLAKIVALLAVKASTLDPFGVGIEMEAEKPGWCDALNGMPGLLGSSVNESLELRRWIRYLDTHLPSMLGAGDKISVATEVVEFVRAVREALSLAKVDDFYKTWDTLASLRERFRERTRLGVSGDETSLSRSEIDAFLQAVANVLDQGLQKPFTRDGLCLTYYINEAVEYEALPPTSSGSPDETPVQYVRVTKFKQVPVSPFLEGTVHALRVLDDQAQIRKLYKAVKNSELYDRKLKMFRLNVPLTKESYEVGRNKIFTPGWLENESVFLHMAYKFLLETLRSGMPEEFFDDFRKGLVAFQNPSVYGRSTYENSSFICSSRFPDKRVHGSGFVARLTGATAEWISMVLHMGLGAQPFRWVEGKLRFQPEPTLAKWLFTKKAQGDFDRDTFGFKLFGRTWVVYHNPSRRDTFGGKPLAPVRFALRYADGQEAIHEGAFLPEREAIDLREGRVTRLTITLQ